ncbi:helix-turn-helix domain-containing protein [Fructobacillus ficulneus]|uniref:DNA-binding helix-turn-helix protein n=1 Tax=Fructobacillus ficulneus TaxID=157463 RepID=A0A0K8MJG5_9LACO|nr:helix-turn-helix transcriptional regulator [Fructobacillus ficulneus]GAP00598.1 DNA-binding helix-turn-helix protein [Fructobacillus ficulneus]
MDIGRRLKQVRENHAMTQAELADYLFVSSQTISNWEREVSQIDLESLIKVLNLFQLSFENFLQGNYDIENYYPDPMYCPRCKEKLR